MNVSRATDISVVVNPSSGRGRAAQLVDDVRAALRDVGCHPNVTVTRDEDDLRRTIRNARARDEQRVLVCGGDGTLHLAVQELAGGDTALGIIPGGTGDDNARTLGIPLADARAAAVLAATGAISRVDLGRARTSDGVERYFLGVMSSGFDSLVNERANRMRWPHGTARYVVAILGELRTFRPVEYRALLDASPVTGPAMLVAIGNGASYGGGMRVCPSADPADGVLDVTWLHGVKTRTFLRVFPQVFSGKHVNTPYVSTFQVTSARLAADGQVAYADGERVGPLPVEVALERSALPVVRGEVPA
jgi:diacylglycerol kinase (ATP)